MLRTLADTLAAALMRRAARSKTTLASPSRLGVERLEIRNLLSTSAGATIDANAWHFEDGTPDPHYVTAPSVTFVPGGYQAASTSAVYHAAEERSPTSVPRRDGFDQIVQSRLSAQTTDGVARSSSEAVSQSVIVIYVTRLESRAPLKAMASPDVAKLSAAAANGVMQGGQAIEGPKYLRASSPLAISASSDGAEQNSQSPGSFNVLSQFDGVTSVASVAAETQDANESAGGEQSRLLQALESHDAVFQSLAAQLTSPNLRGGRSDAIATHVSLTRGALTAHQGSDFGDDLADVDAKTLRASSDQDETSGRGETNIERLVSSESSGRRAGRRSADLDGNPEIAPPSTEETPTPDEGGMVLLQHPGQSRDGAAAIDAAMARLGGAIANSPIDMEAGVGMYRAFNVGASEAAMEASGWASLNAASAEREAAHEAGGNGPVAKPSSGGNVQLAVAAAGAVVLGAWGKKEQDKSDRPQTSGLRF